MDRAFVAIGAGLLLIAAALGIGAAQIRGDAGYAGAGPSFLPWAITAAIALLGVATLVQGWRARTPLVPAELAPPLWGAMGWVSAGVLANALLIEHLGFILSCALLFALAARGFRAGAQEPWTWRDSARDLVAGVVLSTPVYWLFTKALQVTLPGLVKGGWI